MITPSLISKGKKAEKVGASKIVCSLLGGIRNQLLLVDVQYQKKEKKHPRM